jgi:hypothetical protein
MESTMVVLIYIIPPRCIRFPFILHPCQCLLLFMFLMTVILNRVRGSLKVALICIFYIVKGVEHFFVYLMSICTSFFEIFLFSSLCHVFTELLILWEFRCFAPYDFCYQLYNLKRFSSTCRLSFQSSDYSLNYKETF